MLSIGDMNMWHFKGEKRILRDRHIRDVKEWRIFLAEFERKAAESKLLREVKNVNQA